MLRMKLLALAVGAFSMAAVSTAAMAQPQQIRVGQPAGTQQAQDESDDRLLGILLVLGLAGIGIGLAIGLGGNGGSGGTTIAPPVTAPPS
ncbi:MAG: hypothetical protein IT557_16375 [Alphaproteobacteria bacterium]|nr:hypothetical protein [Alphaproteobacteria bacterium]